MQCFNEGSAIAFAQHLLPRERFEDIERHLDACPLCRRTVAAAVIADRVDAQPTSEPTDEGEPLAPALRRGDKVGRYVVLDRLGAGGMGTVYSAYDPDLDRKIALKLLHRRLDDDAVWARFLVEAKAMARIAHPNVVAVYDAGMTDGLAFLAMELVDGVSLREWLKRARRPWRQVHRLLLEAGAGLAAAHAAGLVHRDFKPDNVLVDRGGRPHVTDFGLARVLDASAERGTAALELGATPLTGALTRTGALLGTPVYAAPEQLDRTPVDARADQFSFCVTLHEALFGERPFSGRDTAELRAAIARGVTRHDKHEAKLPRRLREALTRGLAADPGDRFQDMPALLHELRKDPAPARRRMLAGVAVAALVVASIPGYRQILRRPSPVCETAGSLLLGLWDDAQRSAVRAAFSATGLAYADGAFTASDSALRRYLTQWQGRYANACNALDRASDESAAFSLRVGVDCLRRRLADVRARLELFRKADKSIVDTAASSVANLLPVESCPQEPTKAPPPRDDTDVAQIEAQSVHAQALIEANKAKEAAVVASQAVERCRAAGSRASEARALFALGSAQLRLQQSAEAEKSLEQAAVMAEGIGDDELATLAYLRLVGETAYWNRKPEKAAIYLDQAQASIARLANPSYLRARMLEARADIASYLQDNSDSALADNEEALRLYRASVGEDRPETAAVLSMIGTLLAEKGKVTEGVAHQEEALAVRQRVFGPEHVQVSNSLNNLAIAYLGSGDFERAATTHERAYAMRLHLLGADDPSTCMSEARLGVALLHLKRYAEARDHLEQALARLRRILPARHPRLREPLQTLGVVYQRLGEMGKARKLLEEALAVAEATGLTFHAAGATLFQLGALDLQEGKDAAALAAAQRGERLFPGPQAGEQTTLLLLKYLHARALFALGRDQKSALTLIGEYRASLAEIVTREHYLDETLAELDGWLARHAGGSTGPRNRTKP